MTTIEDDRRFSAASLDQARAGFAAALDERTAATAIERSQ